MSRFLGLVILVSAFAVFGPTGTLMASTPTEDSNSLVKCSTCSMGLASSEAIEEHMKSYPGHEVTPSEQPLVKCSTCSMAMASTEAIEEHMKSHPGHEVTPSEQPLVKCSTCSMGFPSRSALEEHMSHHGH